MLSWRSILRGADLAAMVAMRARSVRRTKHFFQLTACDFSPKFPAHHASALPCASVFHPWDTIR